MTEETAYDKIKKANDDYHEAVQHVLLDEELDVELKVRFAGFVNDAFGLMREANDAIKEHYEPEENGGE